MLTRQVQAISWVVDRFGKWCPAIFRDVRMVIGRPTVQELSLTVPLFKDAISCLRSMIDDLDDSQLRVTAEEFGAIDAHLKRRRSEISLRYPANFPVNTETGLLLYSMVRLTRPLRLLETGVADGYSTAIILCALKHNGTGELHSVDVRDDVGVLIEDREHWQLHIADGNRTIQDLRELAYRLRPFDMFFHDSDHRFIAQAHEYDLAEQTVKKGGYLVSDDTDFSYAFLTRAAESGNRSAVLLDDIKCSGVMQFS